MSRLGRQLLSVDEEVTTQPGPSRSSRGRRPIVFNIHDDDSLDEPQPGPSNTSGRLEDVIAADVSLRDII